MEDKDVDDIEFCDDNVDSDLASELTGWNVFDTFMTEMNSCNTAHNDSCATAS